MDDVTASLGASPTPLDGASPRSTCGPRRSPPLARTSPRVADRGLESGRAQEVDELRGVADPHRPQGAVWSRSTPRGRWSALDGLSGVARARVAGGTGTLVGDAERGPTCRS